MKLVFSRDQKSTGLISKSIAFTLDVRADLTPEEETWVRQYKMGGTVLYQKYEITDPGKGLLGLASRLGYKALNTEITVDGLAKGRHFECKDIIEMRTVEEQVKDAARVFREMLETAAHFGGEEVVEV